MTKKNRVMIYISGNTDKKFRAYASEKGVNLNTAIELAMEAAMERDLLSDNQKPFTRESVLAAVLSCFDDPKERSFGRIKMYEAYSGDDHFLIYVSFKEMSSQESSVTSVKGNPITKLIDTAEREGCTPLVFKAIVLPDGQKMVAVINVNETEVMQTKIGNSSIYRSNSDNTLFIRVKTKDDIFHVLKTGQQALPKLYDSIQKAVFQN